MELAERFASAVMQVYARVGAGAELLPMVLAQACGRFCPLLAPG